MTQAVQLAQYGANNVGLSFKNRIINGDMGIDQRNAGAAITFSQNPTYCVDRWATFIGNGTGGIVNTAQGVGVGLEGFRRALLITTTTGGTLSSGDYRIISQTIEGLNIADLDYGNGNAKTVTISFWVYTSVTGNYVLNLANAPTFNRFYATVFNIPSANTWTKITLTIPGDTTGTWTTDHTGGLRLLIGLGASGALATSIITPGWGTSNIFWQTTGAANFLGTTGATFYITGVQFEVGTVATSFDYLPYTTELQLCQRYFCKSSSINVVATNGAAHTTTGMFITGVLAGYTSGNSWVNFIQYPVTMRTEATTVTFINTALPAPATAGQWSVYVGATWINTTSIGIQSFTTQGFGPVMSHAAGTGYMYYGAWTASAEL
jgi:hypothetical protein